MLPKGKNFLTLFLLPFIVYLTLQNSLFVFSLFDLEHNIPKSNHFISIKRKQKLETCGVHVKKLNLNIILILIIFGIGSLVYVSYQAGYKASKNNMDSLLMTMTIDSNLVTSGLYEELPNKVRKTMQFFIEDTPTVVNNVKLFAEVKYVTIDGEVIDVNDGNIWSLIKQERVFQRKFDKNNKKEENKNVPNTSFVENKLKKDINNNLL